MSPFNSTKEATGFKIVDNGPSCFSFRVDPVTGKHIFKINENLTVRERTHAAHILPTLLHEPRILTDTELQQMGWTHWKDDTVYYLDTGSGLLPAAYRASIATLEKLGLIERIANIRQHMLHPAFQPLLHQIYTDAKGAKKMKEKIGSVYELFATIQPTTGVGSIQLGPLARKAEKWDAKWFLDEIADIVQTVMLNTMPEFASTEREHRYTATAPITIGNSNNHIFTSVQANYTPQSKGVQETIGAKFGGVHPDMHDDPTLLTGLFCLTNFDEDHFPGRFNVTTMRITAPWTPYTIGFFSAKHFHCPTGTGKYPSTLAKDSPLRLPPLPAVIPALPKDTPHMRLNLSVYPDVRLFGTKFHLVKTELFGAMGRSLMGAEKHRDWLMSFFMLHEQQIREEILRTPALLKQFAFIDQLGLGSSMALRGLGPEIMTRAIEAVTDRDHVHKQMTGSKKHGKFTKPVYSPPSLKRGADFIDDDAYHGGNNKRSRINIEGSIVQYLNDTNIYSIRPTANATLVATNDLIKFMPRNGNPDFYSLLFTTVSASEETVSHARAHAQKTLHALNTENTKFAKLVDSYAAQNCGTRKSINNADREEAARKGIKAEAGVVWTHQDYKHIFDPSVDKVLL